MQGGSPIPGPHPKTAPRSPLSALCPLEAQDSTKLHLETRAAVRQKHVLRGPRSHRESCVGASGARPPWALPSSIAPSPPTSPGISLSVDATAEDHRQGGFHDRLIFHGCGPWTSELKAPAGPVSGEAPPGSQTATFSLSCPGSGVPSYGHQPCRIRAPPS